MAIDPLRLRYSVLAPGYRFRPNLRMVTIPTTHKSALQLPMGSIRRRSAVIQATQLTMHNYWHTN